MYDFSVHLFENEKILYQGRPVAGKGDKGIKGSLVLIVFSLIMLLLMIFVPDESITIDLTFIIILIVILLFFSLGVWNLVYKAFLKKKCVADDFYCLTDMRAMKYEEKKQKLVFGYLAYYKDIRCIDKKGDYGDLYMGIIAEEKVEPIDTVKFVKDVMVNPNPENMPFIQFQSIQNPVEVKKIALQARMAILDSIEKEKESTK